MDVDEVQTVKDAEGDSGEAEECSNASPCGDVEETTETKKRVKIKMDIDELLKLMVDKSASDLHLTVSSPPIMRIDGSLVPVPEMPPLEPADLTKLFKQATITKQRTAFKKEKELDFAYSLEGVARFRVNALFQRGSISLVFRRVLVDIPSIDGMSTNTRRKARLIEPL
jgi:twitching motility protein PilT